MCNCIEEITDATRQRIKDEIKEPVAEWRDQGSFMYQIFSFDLKGPRISLPFVVEYYRRKKNGEPETKITNKHLNIYPSYCPFCGEKYKS